MPIHAFRDVASSLGGLVLHGLAATAASLCLRANGIGGRRHAEDDELRCGGCDDPVPCNLRHAIQHAASGQVERRPIQTLRTAHQYTHVKGYEKHCFEASEQEQATTCN